MSDQLLTVGLDQISRKMALQIERDLERHIMGGVMDDFVTNTTVSPDGGLTIEHVTRAMRLLDRPVRPLPTAITFTPAALEATEERLFHASRHRSKRIRKKLIKRFGGEYRQQPCIWQTPFGIVAHPALKNRIEKMFEVRL